MSGAPQSVYRVFGILQQLVGKPAGLTLTELSRALGAPKTSLVGLLNGMIAMGFVSRDEGLYRLGHEMYLLATQVIGAGELSALVLPSLQRLAEHTGETALAGQLAPDGMSLVYFAKVESKNPVRYTASVGKREELYSTAMGKLLLAYMEQPARDRYLQKQPLSAFTQQTITDSTRLGEELTTIRERGVAQTCNERVQSASGLAVPVLGRSGQLLFGVGIAGPTERIHQDHATHIRFLQDEAKELRTLLNDVSLAMLTSHS